MIYNLEKKHIFGVYYFLLYRSVHVIRDGIQPIQYHYIMIFVGVLFKKLCCCI